MGGNIESKVQEKYRLAKRLLSSRFQNSFNGEPLSESSYALLARIYDDGIVGKILKNGHIIETFTSNEGQRFVKISQPEVAVDYIIDYAEEFKWLLAENNESHIALMKNAAPDGSAKEAILALRNIMVGIVAGMFDSHVPVKKRLGMFCEVTAETARERCELKLKQAEDDVVEVIGRLGNTDISLDDFVEGFAAGKSVEEMGFSNVFARKFSEACVYNGLRSRIIEDEEDIGDLDPQTKRILAYSSYANIGDSCSLEGLTQELNDTILLSRLIESYSESAQQVLNELSTPDRFRN